MIVKENKITISKASVLGKNFYPEAFEDLNERLIWYTGNKNLEVIYV